MVRPTPSPATTQKEASAAGAQQIDLPPESSAITRRSFLRSAGALGAMLAAPAAAPEQNPSAAESYVSPLDGHEIVMPASPLPTNFKVGIELPSQVPMPVCVMRALREIGLNYVYFFTAQGYNIFDLTPQQISGSGQLEIGKYMAEWCKRAGFDFSAGLQMEDIPDSALEFYGKNDLCQGVLMVEGPHVRQLDWKAYGKRWGLEPWAKVDGLSLPQAYEKALEGIRRSRAHYGSYGLDTMVSCVFPVMFHTIARAGCGVVPKLMGMSYTPVTAAIALGAALQYQSKFWIDLEMWSQGCGMAEPGHSPEAFRSTLLLAYWLGVDHIYVEGAGYIFSPAGAQGIPFTLMTYISDQLYRLTEFGKILRWFCREYVPAHPRPYTFRDATPEVAIVRFPDTDWGQSYAPAEVRKYGFLDELYGAENLHPDPRTQAWFKIWNLLTHGSTGADGITYMKQRIANLLKSPNSDFSPVPENVALHPFFSPLNNVAVFDHLVGEAPLATAKLIFLTGIMVSGETMQAVSKRVEAGATCVALRSLIGNVAAGKGGGTVIVPEGAGKWVITEDFGDPLVRAHVEPFLGDSQEIRFQFGKHELRLRCVGGDRNRVVRIEG